MKIKSLLLIGSMAVFGMAMSSCSKEENLFDSDAAQAKRMDTYKANFEKKYGPIDPNQSWDFAPAAPVYLPVSKGTTRSAADFSITRGDDNIYIENDILQYMHSKSALKISLSHIRMKNQKTEGHWLMLQSLLILDIRRSLYYKFL